MCQVLGVPSGAHSRVGSHRDFTASLARGATTRLLLEAGSMARGLGWRAQESSSLSGSVSEGLGAIPETLF